MEATCSSCAALWPMLSRFPKTILILQSCLALKLLLQLYLFDKAGLYSCSFKTCPDSFFIWKSVLLIHILSKLLLRSFNLDSGNNLTWMGISVGRERIVNLCWNSLYGSFFANQYTSIKHIYDIMGFFFNCTSLNIQDCSFSICLSAIRWQLLLVYFVLRGTSDKDRFQNPVGEILTWSLFFMFYLHPVWFFLFQVHV